jgi:hypothetical protein
MGWVAKRCWACLGTVLLLGCARARGGPAEPLAAPTAAGAGTDASGPLPRLEAGPSVRPTPLAADPLWQRAARGDVIDLARLADRAGAMELLESVELGGTIGLTALSALPFAEDAELALGPLCELARRFPAERVGPIARAIEAILSRAPRPTERLDGAGLVACRSQLAGVEVAARLSPGDRDRIANARALLEEWLEGR